MAMKKVFVSNYSFQEAEQLATNAGFIVVGRVINPRGQFVVFGRR